jgi:hypothetical protein
MIIADKQGFYYAINFYIRKVYLQINKTKTQGILPACNILIDKIIPS